MSERSSWSKGWRGIVLILVGIVMGANLITPAVGHVGGTVNHLWTKHIRPKTDARYYKKAQSNARYLPGGNLAPGSTVRGAFYVLGTATAGSQFESGMASFGWSLPAAPTTHYIMAGDTPPAECPGTGANPQAAAGHLCVYEQSASNVTSFRGIDQTRPWGFGLWNQSNAAGLFFTYGTWAVKAAAPTAAPLRTGSSAGPTG